MTWKPQKGTCIECNEPRFLVVKEGLCDYHNKLKKGKEVLKKFKTKRTTSDHKKVYLKSMKFDNGDFVPCEVCGQPAVDIHHVKFQSKFGKKISFLKNLITNLIALCRGCHDKAHVTGELKEEDFIKIIEARPLK